MSNEKTKVIVKWSKIKRKGNLPITDFMVLNFITNKWKRTARYSKLHMGNFVDERFKDIFNARYSKLHMGSMPKFCRGVRKI